MELLGCYMFLEVLGAQVGLCSPAPAAPWVLEAPEFASQCLPVAQGGQRDSCSKMGWNHIPAGTAGQEGKEDTV